VPLRSEHRHRKLTLTPQAAAHARAVLIGRDPVLARVIAATPALDLSPAPDRFTALVEAIVAQQLSAAAARTVLGRVLARVGDPAAPAAVSAASVDDLRACGLSRAKVRYVQAAAAMVADGRLDLATIHLRADDDALAHLTAVPGIGRWSGEMFLMFTLARPDVWSAGDAALRAAICRAWARDPADYLAWGAALAETWRPWRSVACRHLYAWYDLERRRAAAPGFLR